MNRIKAFINKNKKEIIVSSIIFLFFLVLLNLIPLTGDDWDNYPESIRGFRHWLGQAAGKYLEWEGRLASRLLINALTASKWLWNIFNAASFALLYFFTMKFIGARKRSYASLIFILGILLFSNGTVIQTYFWVTGNLTYFTPMVLIVIYFYLIKLYMEEKLKSKILYFIWICFNIGIPMFIETAGAVMIFSNLILLIYTRIMKKRWDKLFIISFITSVASFLSMALSPGNRFRIANDTPEFYQLSLIEQMLANIPSYIKYTIARQNIFLILLPIVFVYLVWNNIKNNIVRYLSIVFNIIPYICLLLNIANSSLYGDISLLSFMKNLNYLYDMNIGMIIYWIIYLIALFILLIMHYRKNHNIIFIFVMGLIANASMLISPIWEGRTTLFTVTMILIVITAVFSEFDGKIKYDKLFKGFCLLSIVMISSIYLILYNSVHKQNIVREAAIKEQLHNNSESITIEGMPIYVLPFINPPAAYHITAFKDYYGIPRERELIIIPIKYKYLIFYKGV